MYKTSLTHPAELELFLYISHYVVKNIDRMSYFLLLLQKMELSIPLNSNNIGNAFALIVSAEGNISILKAPQTEKQLQE